MFCPSCGAQIDDNVLFCPECGNRIEDRQQLSFSDSINDIPFENTKQDAVIFEAPPAQNVPLFAPSSSNPWAAGNTQKNAPEITPKTYFAPSENTPWTPKSAPGITPKTHFEASGATPWMDTGRNSVSGSAPNQSERKIIPDIAVSSAPLLTNDSLKQFFCDQLLPQEKDRKNSANADRLNLRLDTFAGQGLLYEVYRDFQASKNIDIDGVLRLGNHWLYTCCDSAVIAYSEIIKIYQAVQKTRTSETGRFLQVETADGECYNLVPLTKGDAGGAEQAQHYMLQIMVHNRKIHVGYR